LLRKKIWLQIELRTKSQMWSFKNDVMHLWGRGCPQAVSHLIQRNHIKIQVGAAIKISISNRRYYWMTPLNSGKRFSLPFCFKLIGFSKNSRLTPNPSGKASVAIPLLRHWDPIWHLFKYKKMITHHIHLLMRVSHLHSTVYWKIFMTITCVFII